MTVPMVSVILPVRDGGTYLVDAVDSILGQTLVDLELLVVDDHSSDGFPETLARTDPRLRIIPSAGTGVVNAFTTGMEQAAGRYVARMDADDLARPRRLELQARLLDQNPGIDIVGACVQFFSTGGIAGGNRHYQDWLNSVREPEIIRKQLFVESPIPNPTAMFRAQALQALNGYRNCEFPEDYDLFLRADAAGMRMAKPEEVLLDWRDHPGRLTRTDELYARSRFQAAKAHFLANHRLPERPLMIWGAGPTGKQMYDLLAQEGREAMGFVEIHPRRIGGRKRGQPVYSMEQLSQHPEPFVLVAVGARGVRQEIRAFMTGIGRREGDDYLFVA